MTIVTQLDDTGAFNVFRAGRPIGCLYVIPFLGQTEFWSVPSEGTMQDHKTYDEALRRILAAR